MNHPRPFGFTIYEDSMYWADWLTKEIIKSDRDGENQVTLQSNLGNVMDITVFHRNRPQSECILKVCIHQDCKLLIFCDGPFFAIS